SVAVISAPRKEGLGEGRATISPAFGKAEEVVGLLAVVLGLQVLVTVLARGHDHVHSATAPADEERPFVAVDPGDGVLLCELPRSSVAVATSDMRDALVRVHAVTLVDADDFVAIWHCRSPLLVKNGRNKIR